MTIDRDGSQIAALMRKHNIRLLTLGWDDAGGVLGIDAPFNLAMETAQQALDDRGKLIRNVAETTRDDVRRLTGQAAELGWSQSELAAEIRKLGEIASASRAMLIAVTETASMYNIGSLISYAESGQVSGVEVLDGTNDEICAAANGQVWTLEEARDNPIGHPRCVRAFVPVLRTEG